MILKTTCDPVNRSLFPVDRSTLEIWRRGRGLTRLELSLIVGRRHVLRRAFLIELIEVGALHPMRCGLIQDLWLRLHQLGHGHLYSKQMLWFVEQDAANSNPYVPAERRPHR